MSERIDDASATDPIGYGEAGRPYGRLREGAQVTIYRFALTRRPFIEGTATLLGVFDEGRDLYWVRFAGETVPRLRLVHAGPWQSQPDATLRALLAHWRHADDLESLAPLLSEDDGRAPGEGG